MNIPLDPGSSWIRPSVRVFLGAMEAKLRRDDLRKEPWETLSLSELWSLLEDEVDELNDAVLMFSLGQSDPGGELVMQECADVANMAMMIFTQFHRLTRHNRRGYPIPAIPRYSQENNEMGG